MILPIAGPLVLFIKISQATIKSQRDKLPANISVTDRFVIHKSSIQSITTKSVTDKLSINASVADKLSIVALVIVASTADKLLTQRSSTQLINTISVTLSVLTHKL